MDDNLKKEVRKIALQNAYEHGGDTKDKIVLSKILGTKPELRTKVKEIIGEISQIVSDINQKSLEEQQKEIEDTFPDLLKPKEKKEEKEGLPPLENAIQGKVITRFPPEPNGYPHIGHAKAAIINEEYAKMYEGKKILRMDDTNPEAERMEYYAAIKVGLEWLGIKYDIVKNTSDDLELLLEKGTELINHGKAYVCTCKRDDISKNRREMKSCKCSMSDV
ncbi:MAG: glutamate--tRNA ligase, partial [Nitrosopumilaceae archaeon]|nr:glutamate--tRNA ligase [Nitrosopumilaceae archaeon]NIU01373.1 glutamate--tRNA ligase [Nitrosopumilaceae archaeon]NIU86569.1 glutamate--tRNA ligase [Nitrosopumilaceae archaeon]NIX61975.1 glutamate--tRNA ligase [Nitrosopumilaceae archaeon]